MTDMPYRPENEGPLATPAELASETTGFVAVEAPFATPDRLERARDLVRTLAVTYTNATLYPTSHPSVAQSLSDFVGVLRALAAFGFDEVTINIYKGTVFVENQIFSEESVTYSKLVEELLDRGISAVTFTSMTTADETAVFVELIASSRRHRHRGRARVPRGPRHHLDHRRRDHHARGLRQRAAQPRGPRACPRELRRRPVRDARRRDAGQARPRARGRPAAARRRVDAGQPASGPGRGSRPDGDQGARRLHAQPLHQRVHPEHLARLGARARTRRRSARSGWPVCSTTSARSASPRRS